MSAPRIGLLSAWLSRRNGGVWEAVVAQAAAVRACGGTPVVIGLADAATAADRARLGEAEVIACAPRGPARLGYAPGMADALGRADLDILHLHGVWTAASAAAAAWARRSGRPYVISPHGMLDPWILARGRARKWAGRLLFERRSWSAATLFHALTDREADAVRAATERDAIAVVPNAVIGSPGPPARPPIVLALGRIHPKKNLPALVDGWALAGGALRRHGARLVIAGWGDAGDVQALEARIARHDGDDIHFVGPLFGEEKRRALAEARFLALPSFGEGLPMAILEAWAAATPTLMSDGCNLPCGFDRGAAIACGTEAATIAAALRRAFALDDARWTAMSRAAVTLAATRFAPATVFDQWRGIYRALLAADTRATA